MPDLHSNGWACDKFGYRKTIGMSLILIMAFVSIPFSAKSIEVLLVGEFLCGLPWGVVSSMNVWTLRHTDASQ